jgi:Tfp pilus assembly protein PilX
MLAHMDAGAMIMNYIMSLLVMSLLVVGFIAAVMLGIVRTPNQLQSSSASRVAADASGFSFLSQSGERPER